MSTSTSHDTELDLSTIEHLEFEIPCEIGWSGKFGWHPTEEHPADWAVLKSCGCTVNICDRWLEYATTGGPLLYCVRCGAHRITYLQIIPIRDRG